MIKIINCGGAAFSVGISGGLAPRRPANGDTLNYKWRRGRCRFASFDVRKFLEGEREGEREDLVPWPGANSISRSASFSTGIALLDLRKNRRRRRLDFGARGGLSRSKATSLYLYVPF